MLRGERSNVYLIPYAWRQCIRQMVVEQRSYLRVRGDHEFKKNHVLKQLMIELSPIYKSLIARCRPEYLAYCRAIANSREWFDKDWITEDHIMLSNPSALSRLANDPALLALWIGYMNCDLPRSGTSAMVEFLNKILHSKSTLEILCNDVELQRPEVVTESLKFFPNKSRASYVYRLTTRDVNIIDRPLNSVVKWSIFFADRMSYGGLLYRTAMEFVDKNGERAFVDFFVNQRSYLFPYGYDTDIANAVWGAKKFSVNDATYLADEIASCWCDNGVSASPVKGMEKFSLKALNYGDEYFQSNFRSSATADRYDW